MTHDDLVAVLLLLGVGAVDVAAEGGLDASPVFVILLEDGTEGEIRPRPRDFITGADAPPMQRMREEFHSRRSPPPTHAGGGRGDDTVVEIRPATHPRGSAPTHRPVTAAGSFRMQPPEQQQRAGGGFLSPRRPASSG